MVVHHREICFLIFVKLERCTIRNAVNFLNQLVFISPDWWCVSLLLILLPSWLIILYRHLTSWTLEHINIHGLEFILLFSISDGICWALSSREIMRDLIWFKSRLADGLHANDSISFWLTILWILWLNSSFQLIWLLVSDGFEFCLVLFVYFWDLVYLTPNLAIKHVESLVEYWLVISSANVSMEWFIQL